MGKQNNKFLAAKARHNIILAYGFLHKLCQRFKHNIPKKVAIGVIKTFKIINIIKDDRNLIP